VREVSADELLAKTSPLGGALDRLIARWLAARAMPKMGFLVELEPFAAHHERRYLAAEQEGRLVGFAALVPVYARGGWFVEFLLRDPEAPNGTAELLFDGAVALCRKEQSRYLTLGVAPLSGAVGGWLRAARSLGKGLYDFAGLRAFKAKLSPSSWVPIYVTHASPQGVASTIYDVLSAFSRGGFLRFALRALLRGPAVVVRLLAALLVPWILLLVIADARHWFPSPWVKWAWVGFDVAVALALFALARRWRPLLGLILAAAVTADAVLTWLQALVFNAPRLHGPLDWTIAACAVAAPTLAAVILWQARTHRRRASLHT
jgi:phosphatidylglycerol lysyltransferase